HGGGELADQTVRRIQGGERDAGHGGGQGERQVDQRVDQLAARKTVTHQHPGQQGTDDAVQHGGAEGGGEPEFQRGQHTRRGGDGDELVPGQLGGLHEQGDRKSVV